MARATELELPFDVEALRAARAGKRLGRFCHYFETTDSTNSVAQQLARDGAAEGTVVIADAQTKGRGRLGRSWSSPPFRNLYLSVILRPPIALGEAPQLALVVGAAIAEAIREWAPHATLKWPNDVLLEGKKVSGALTELEVVSDGIAFVIAGIGVNLNIHDDELPDELRDKAIGLCSITGAAIDRVAFADTLLARLESLYDTYLSSGFAAIRPRWEQLSALTGRRLQVDDCGRRYAGIALGLADDGALRLRLDDGREQTIVAGDVTVVDGYAPGR
ncbi:MAG: biotin--[acetyl-CoA-carboxylase] ligase [Deltaproteobacteria bacterium]|nr:biotin--[acetyl-CoA-carboxylase] ligase [Deltaproteobacteria bacterium]